MKMTKSIWGTLSTINCTAHVDKKGQFSYLSWTWAWAMVKENYPLANYKLEDDIVYPDGTMEVRVSVSIDDVTHTMWLPVLNFKNAAIACPNAFDINSSRMRCLVKCFAMFGLGHYIYAGESLPQQQESEIQPAAKKDISKELEQLNSATNLEKLSATFKMLYRSLPVSAREELTAVKDVKKAQFFKEAETNE